MPGIGRHRVVRGADDDAAEKADGSSGESEGGAALIALHLHLSPQLVTEH
jgi:hypothetical protein